MTKTTPQIKVDAVRAYKAKVTLVGDSYDEANLHAQDFAKQRNMTFIPPYDDSQVIAGQATVAVEILEQVDKPDIIFVPVGGGGLIAGIAAYAKHINPKIKIIGVEPVDAACMHDALKADRRVSLKQVGIFADGVAVKQVGKYPFAIARKLVDEVILVSVDEICAAIKDIFDDTRAVTEPAGALAVAGLKKYIKRNKIKNKTLVAIQSGANVNFDRLRHIAERAEIGEKKEMVFAATINEQPGSFRKFCNILGKRQVTEFNYRYFDKAIAHVFVGVELSENDTNKSILQSLTKEKINVVDLTDNELAKQHVRYMVGGHPPPILDETLYRFEFPERPGALLNFLSAIGSKWNISLFHYRNHGAAYGRALVGVQVPKNERKNLEQYLDKLAFAYKRETDNPAYNIFLA
jgi:threonine dehydratase